MKNSEIKEVTGLKGIAALIVMLSHYAIAFFPAVWNAEYESAHILVAEKFIHRTPLYFFFNGSQMVSLFWCISGFLLGYAWYKNKDIPLLKKRILGRYFKLVIPVLFSMILAYIFRVNNLFYNNVASRYTWSEWLAGFYQWEPSLLLSIVDGLYGVFFVGSCEYNPILWTIKAEVFGIAFSSLFLLVFSEGDDKKRNSVYFFFSFILNFIYQPLFAFLIGLFISDKYLNGNRVSKKKSVVFFIIALILGSFLPIWKYIPMEINFSNEIIISIAEIFRSIAAGLLLVCVLNVKAIKELLSAKIFYFIGNISMYLYIYHFVIMCSFSCWFFVYIFDFMKINYIVCSITSMVFGIGFTIFICFLLKVGIEKITNKMIKKIYNIL